MRYWVITGPNGEDLKVPASVHRIVDGWFLLEHDDRIMAAVPPGSAGWIFEVSADDYDELEGVDEEDD